MATFDIRFKENDPIDRIQIQDDLFFAKAATTSFYVQASDQDYFRVDSKKEVEHLIKGLQKAIELGWVK